MELTIVVGWPGCGRELLAREVRLAAVAAGRKKGLPQCYLAGPEWVL